MDIKLNVKDGQKLYYVKYEGTTWGRKYLKYNITAEGKDILSWKPKKNGIEVSMCGIPIRTFDYTGRHPFILDPTNPRVIKNWEEWGYEYYGVDLNTYLNNTYELHVGYRKENTFSNGDTFVSYSDIKTINEIILKRKVRQCIIYDTEAVIIRWHVNQYQPTERDLAIQELCESGQIPQKQADLPDEWFFKPYMSPFYFHPEQNDDGLLEELKEDYGCSSTSEFVEKYFDIHNFRVDKALKAML